MSGAAAAEEAAVPVDNILVIYSSLMCWATRGGYGLGAAAAEEVAVLV